MRTDSDNLVDYGRQKAAPINIDPDKPGVPFLITRRDEPVSLEKFAEAPARPRGHYAAQEFQSAFDFLTRFRSAKTAVFWSKPLLAARGTAIAVIDFHGQNEEPGFCEFTIRFKCSRKELSSLKLPVFVGKFKPTRL